MLIIAVDGPSCAGKGSICKELSKRLNIKHVDTGSIYRVLAYYMHNNNIDINNESAVVEALANVNIELKHIENEQHIFLNGEDVSSKIRSSFIDKICAITSRYEMLKIYVRNIQRDLASRYDLIMEGRDITSRVLPNANYRFFITASPETRAKRRLQNYLDKGEDVPYEEVLASIKERDRKDIYEQADITTNLLLTEGCIYIENDDQTLEETVNLMLSIINE
ncbi:MAG: (d)CMP kinase [Clostridia bacterium]|nr:(d)CMP kinase [Clostridia bacterium]